MADRDDEVLEVVAHKRTEERHQDIALFVEVCDQLRGKGRTDDEIVSMAMEFVWFVIGGCDHKCLHMFSRGGNMYAEVYREDSADGLDTCNTCGEEVQA